ncbi:hypothetical protein [Roseinatronobacter sp. NSM]|uniref:hypothetical protein n=1 Tax=Roseinatronobacter sp. NSM TaxID=3457785 RepID=UPI004036E175
MGRNKSQHPRSGLNGYRYPNDAIASSQCHDFFPAGRRFITLNEFCPFRFDLAGHIQRSIMRAADTLPSRRTCDQRVQTWRDAAWTINFGI